MDRTHLDPLLDALHRGDPSDLDAHLADAVVLRSPILPEPIRGKAAVARILAALVSVADSFTVTDWVEGENRAAVFVTIRSGDVSVDGIDDMHVDGDGLISSMTIQWRPLPAVVEMQRRLAPAIGAPRLRLVQE